MNESSHPGIWSYANPVRMTVGPGAFRQLNAMPPLRDSRTGSEAGKVLLVTTAGFTRRGRTAQVQAQLGTGRLLVYDRITPNPELDALDQATRRFRAESIDCIIALGGGSVLDAAKVLAVTLACDVEQPLHHILRKGHSHVWGKGIPLIAIPTTSGTGAEVTPFATVWDVANHKKYSVAGEHVVPTQALIDPELTVALPPRETLHTALDAISHGLESLWNRNRNPLSAAHAIQALALANQALPAVLAEPDNLEARGNMQQASLLAGLAISQTRTAIAHSMSYPLTTHFGVPHGLACSFTLPALLRANLDTLAAFPHERELFVSLLNLLEGLALGEKIREYASADQVWALQDEMSHGRATNYSAACDLEGILKDTLTR